MSYTRYKAIPTAKHVKQREQVFTLCSHRGKYKEIKKESQATMPLENDDTFDDDDDFDLEQVYNNAQATQPSGQSQTYGPKDDIYQMKGENAILRGQIEKIHKEQTEAQKRLKEDFDKMLRDKESYIQALNESLSKMKSENEFLVSENKNLYQTNSRKRKLRSVDSNSTALSQHETSTQNTSHMSASTQNTTPAMNEENNSRSEVERISEKKSHTDVKVVVVNQATFFQDEKTLFIEAVTNYVISGMPRPTLNYLENISSTFDYTSNDFQILANENSFKSAILRYLINFQDKNRIDYLLINFIEILLEYVIQTFELDESQLLPIPFLLSLINFALNYRPKAINEKFIGETTDKIVSMLWHFQGIFKPEFDYLSLPGSNHMMNFVTMQDKENSGLMDYSFVEKTMHVKILEVFTAIFLMDLLSTLSKVASFHVFTFTNSSANSTFWKKVPQQNMVNSFLSRKTPIHFIYSTVEILLNSIHDDDRFAFGNTRRNSITKPTTANEITIQILEQIMQFLTTISPSQIHFNVFGLNHLIGSNHHLELLEMVSIPSNKLSSYPQTHSFDQYEEILRTKFEYFQKQEHYILSTKMLIMDLFESFYSALIMITLPLNTNSKLTRILCQMIGEEQEMIIRSPRSSNNNLRIDLISKSVKILHHLIAQESSVKINELSNLTLREMIIVLLRISSKSMKNESIDFVTKLRHANYNGVLFNGVQEKNELDKYGLWNSILSLTKLPPKEQKRVTENRIQIEIDLYNGIEFGYSDETIDLARDIVGMCVTGDEADRLHDSINYVNDEDEDYEMAELGDFEGSA